LLAGQTAFRSAAPLRTLRRFSCIAVGLYKINMRPHLEGVIFKLKNKKKLKKKIILAAGAKFTFPNLSMSVLRRQVRVNPARRHK